MENNQNTSVMSVQDWIITILLASIPLVNIIMLFIWAFGSDTNKNKQNWAKATLIWFAIILGLYIVFGVLFGITMFMNN